VQVDDHVLEFGVPEQELYGPQVRSRFHQVGGVRVAKQMG
jgi:hypothetical protein